MKLAERKKVQKGITYACLFLYFLYTHMTGKSYFEEIQRVNSDSCHFFYENKEKEVIAMYV